MIDIKPVIGFEPKRAAPGVATLAERPRLFDLPAAGRGILFAPVRTADIIRPRGPNRRAPAVPAVGLAAPDLRWRAVVAQTPIRRAGNAAVDAVGRHSAQAIE